MNRRMITLWRIITAGVQNFLRNATLAIAAMAVMVITLTILLFSVIANATFSHTVQQITDKIDVSVFLKDSVNNDQTNKLISDLKNVSNVKDVTYKSKDQVLNDYKSQNQTNVSLLLAVSQIDNPLPATIIIKPVDPNKIQDIKNYLDQSNIKELQSSPTSYDGARKDAIDKIAKATKFFREVGLTGVIVFALVSILIIFNTIRMAIFNRRDELMIMRLLGASTFYIRGPFIVETVIYGIASALISIALCNALFLISSSALDASSLGLLDIKYANNYFSQHFWIILGTQLTLGILIGAISSLVATRRYLKFKSGS